LIYEEQEEICGSKHAIPLRSIKENFHLFMSWVAKASLVRRNACDCWRI